MEDNTPVVNAAPEEKKGGPRKFVVGAIVAVAAATIATKAYGSFTFGQTHVETDNAYVTGDLVGIGPTVSGTLVELKVKDGDFVKKGQAIARLDTAGAQAELDQAEANYQAALTGVPQAEAALAFEKLSTQAAIQRSQAMIAAQVAKTAGSRLQVQLSADTVKNQVKQAQRTLAQAQAQAAQADAGIATARADLVSAQAAVQTATNNADAQNALVSGSQADADRAAGDLDRYRKLLANEAISRQQYDAAVATSGAALSNLNGAKERARGAVSAIAQAKAGVAQANAHLFAAQKQAEAAKRQVEVAQAGIDLARSGSTQTGIDDTNVQNSLGETSRATADLATAQAGSEQVTLRSKQIQAARAQVEQARAAVIRARVRMRDANLYAPCDGYVVKHSVNVGTSINPGQNIVTITRGNDVWVMANFKETQLAGVRPGQPVELEVDAFPGAKFHGRVESILRATGSATTLLPPDNSTGNFTKVVQRLPVRISIEATDGTSEIRQGMSVIATIDTAKGKE